MDTNTTSADTAVTDTADQANSQEVTKTYSQQEVDNMIAGMKSSLQKKLLKPYEELGDINELRSLREQAQKAQQEQQLKRGEFDKIIADLARKKDAEIARRDTIIQEYRVDTPLLNAAAQMRSVNPEQVKSLLRGNVRLNGDGEVEIVDGKGQVRYTDAGTPYQVSDLVKEFLEANPHFVQPTPATTNSRSSISANVNEVDVTKLDLRLAEHRQLAKEWQSKKK
jgi:PIN domain nuclease of toxin-antitoxin system